MIDRSEVEVYLDEGGKIQLVGTLKPSFTGGSSLASTSFRYSPGYLASTNGYTISPDLPLVAGTSYTAANQNIFGAFADASPDLWGQKIITANHAIQLRSDPSLPRVIGDFDFLLGVADFSRMGALRLRRSDSDEWLSSDHHGANLHDLARILEVAGRYEDDEATDEDVAYLSDVATSPGGARPKANVTTASGRLAIAKLPHSKDGNQDTEAWEALALSLAERIGSRIPRFARYPASESKSVLVVERFDRTDSGDRIGYISAATALGIGKHDDSRATYEDFADVIAELSGNPRGDLREMFGRIALSVLINNVDDHWRNHGFLRQNGAWRLAPIFDVNPFATHGSITSRAISTADDPRNRDIRNLLAIADAYQLTTGEAAHIIGMVARAVETWPALAHQLGIPDTQQRTMSGAFNEEHIERAKSLRPRASTEASPSAPGASGSSVWVQPHRRGGDDVDGYWRTARDKKP